MAEYGRFVTETKLRQRHAVAQRHEAGTYPLADSNLLLVLGPRWIVGADQVTDEAHGYQLILAAALPRNRSLLVKLDQHDRVRNPVAERRLNRLDDDLVAVDRAQAAHRPPIPFPRHAERAGRPDGAPRDQARIRHRLRQLGIRRRHWATPAGRPVTGWGSLTETEQAVAGLVAEGLNNSQVAARMYISTHTVAHHLRQTFRKLSIASRVELTRIVIDHHEAG